MFCHIVIEYMKQNYCPKVVTMLFGNILITIITVRLLQYYFYILVKVKEDNIRRMFLEYWEIKSKKNILQTY